MKWFKQFVNSLFFYIFIVTLFAGGGFLIYYFSAKGYPLWLLWIVFIYFLQATFSIAIFTQHRQNNAKLSWLIVTVLFPLFGHIIFLLFGLRYDDRKSLAKYRQKHNFQYERKETLPIENELLSTIFQQQQNISHRGVYQGDFEIFQNGELGFAKLFSDITKAKKFIHIEYYIIKPGEIYEHFKSLIIQKVQEGVKVRMIIDDFGHWKLPWYEIGAMRKKGVEIRILGRVYFPFIGSKNGYRNHRKLVIIDGKIVHSGGTNIADEYVSLDKKYGVWIDYHIKVTGPIVRSYSLLFLEDWNYIGHPIKNFENYLLESKQGNSNAILIESTPEVREQIIEDSIIKWISFSRNSIKIATPYFVPTPAIFNALKTAALSGVDVQIYVPGKSDNKKIVYTATKYWCGQLAQYGAKIFMAKNMIIHSKIGLFDNSYAYLGTFNLDFRSMYSQFELTALVSGEIIKDIFELFNYYLLISKLVGVKDLKTNLIREKMLRLFLTFLAPIM